jgi:hypothetical protein
VGRSVSTLTGTTARWNLFSVEQQMTAFCANDWQGDFLDKYRAVGIDKIRSPQQLHLTPNFVAFTRERAAFRHWPERTKPLELPLARF